MSLRYFGGRGKLFCKIEFVSAEHIGVGGFRKLWMIRGGVLSGYTSAMLRVGSCTVMFHGYKA